jgi:hypothetical protein
MLTTDFPVDTVAHLQSSYQKLDYLTREGVLGDPFDYQSILPWLGAAMLAKAETFAAPTAAVVGAAGTTTRYYAVVPTYPLEYPDGAASLPYGRYLNFLGGKPPYGFPAASAISNVQNTVEGSTRLYGPVSPLATVANTDATLSASNYIALTMPAAKNLTGLLFDIVSSDDNGNYFLVAVGVAPGATFDDTGAVAGLELYGAAYNMRAYPEIGYDTASSTTIYGSLTRK